MRDRHRRKDAMQIQIPGNEYWYGGYVWGSESMPVRGQDRKVFDFTINSTPNQGVPLLLSSQGRYLWGDDGSRAVMENGMIRTEGDMEIREGYGDLRGAYKNAMKRYFPFRNITLDNALFETPVYNTWIELTFNQNEKDILDYAGGILEHGMPPGVLMIDDGWSDYYGKWTFNAERFPHPEDMIRKLHNMGFKVMLWVCPYVTPDTTAYREAERKGLLIRKNGEPFILKWWNGYSAALDLSCPEAVKWLDTQFKKLIDAGIDGFKFDAGDSPYYDRGQQTFGDVLPDEMSRLWCVYGEKYPLNEYRAAWKAGGMSLMQRLCDKPHSWGKDGIGALIPDMLAQGILGMPFGSPDMIGGGEYLNFLENSERLDQELFVRHAEIACLMPVMQFSAAPWRVLDQEHFRAVKRSVQIRQETLPYLMECIEDAKRTGEPVIRYMEYAFPGCGMAGENTQFMAGERLLVAPVYEKGASGRKVIVPRGKWRLADRVIEGGGSEQFFVTEPGVPVMLWYMGEKEGNL